MGLEENEKLILKAKDLLNTNAVEGIKLFINIKISSKEEAEEIYSIVNSISTADVDTAYYVSFLLCKIIENECSTDGFVELCFQQIIPMLQSENHEIANRVFDNIRYSLKGYEKQKYGLLHIYLTNTKEINVLNDFFYNFYDPIYLFDILKRRYNAIGFRMSVDNYSNTIYNFWRKNKIATEAQMLNLFSHSQFGMLATKIIVSGHYDVYPINLLKLDTKEKQKLAIQSILNFPHSIDKLLPLVLSLRNSKFKEVIIFLQNTLSELIFEAYHSTLLDLVKKNITTSSKDKKFIEPLKDANDNYEKMRELKGQIMDLDPRENERHLMDLYYSLEHETQAIMMKDNKKDNSFLSAVKTMVIVRGNSWKLENHEIPSPMQLIQSSVLIDSRAYKNPLDYEYNLENL
jgi:hypothetical protein